jgi:hypothetical protein
MIVPFVPIALFAPALARFVTWSVPPATVVVPP